MKKIDDKKKISSEWFKELYNPETEETMYVLVGDTEAYEVASREVAWILRTQCARQGH